MVHIKNSWPFFTGKAKRERHYQTEDNIVYTLLTKFASMLVFITIQTLARVRVEQLMKVAVARIYIHF